jgi:hypothetical protein
MSSYSYRSEEVKLSPLFLDIMAYGNAQMNIKQGDLIQRILDPFSYYKFIQDEVDNTSPRKVVDGMTVYLSTQFRWQKQLRLLLCDFGSAVRGEEPRSHFVQPDILKEP